DSLAARVLAEEHALYPEVVRQIAEGSVAIREGRIERAGTIRHHREPVKESEKSVMSHSAHSHAAPPQADAEAVARSRQMWQGFIKASLIAGGAVAVTLALMALFLV